MKYISTRGGIAPVSFSQAVMMGLATDGGLLLPERIPVVDDATLRHWVNLSFVELAVEVMRPYVGEDLSEQELVKLVQRSYATFTHSEITPVIFVGRRPVLELFHGPTLAFKDVALQFLGNLFEHILERSGGVLNILGATSGDTGSAAIYGVRGKERIRIFMLHPYQKISLVQERQMTSVLDDNVHNIAIRGDFDDGQEIIKTLFRDYEFKKNLQLGAVNSINWARIMAQITYYFYAWGRLTQAKNSFDVKASFSVPTGNFGDIFAGYMACRMGLPVDRLILATNRNDILTRFLQDGVYETGVNYATLTPAMDIQVASNFERFLYYLVREDAEEVRRRMEIFASERSMRFSEEERIEAASVFATASIGEDETLAAIREVYRQEGYLMDPHTAVGVAAARYDPEAVSLATAHPAKFSEAVERATGHVPQLPEPFMNLLERSHRRIVLDADSAAIRRYLVKHVSEHVSAESQKKV